MVKRHKHAEIMEEKMFGTAKKSKNWQHMTNWIAPSWSNSVKNNHREPLNRLYKPIK